MFLVHKTSRFILKNIFLIIFSIFLSSFFIAPVYAQVTENFVVVSGVDKSSGTAKDFTANDIQKLTASDSEPGNGIDRMGSDKWPDENQYDEDKYIEFVFSPDVPTDAMITEVKITHEFQRSGALAGAKIEVLDGENFVEQTGTTVGISGEDHTDIIDITSILDTPGKINNTKIRFLAYRATATQSGTKTSHDFIGLSVTYDTPPPEEEEPPPAEEPPEEEPPIPNLVFTEVSSDITEDTTWTLNNSPYIISKEDINVAKEATLTIEPGVVVKFAPNRNITVNGRILVEGTIDNKIILTSINDDSIGGDTGDADLNNALLRWQGILLQDSSALNIFKYVLLKYVFTGLEFSSSSNSVVTNIEVINSDRGILISESDITIKDVIMKDINTGIIVLQNSHLIGSNINIENSSSEGAIILTQNGKNKNVLDKYPRADLENIFLKNGNKYGIYVEQNSKLKIKNGEIDGFKDSGVKCFSSAVTTLFSHPHSFIDITYTKIQNNTFGIYSENCNSILKNNYISKNSKYGLFSLQKSAYPVVVVDASNNYWGHPSGPSHFFLNRPGLGDKIFVDRISINFILEPWLTKDPFIKTEECVKDCFSNIMFLPGMMGSNLYEAGLDCGDVIVGSECGDKSIWVSILDNLQEKLSLDTLGKSINNIFTKNDTQYDGEDETGIIDEIGPFNIYKSFISDLKKWKEEEKIIEDYAFIPYDWRLSLEDIITNGKVTGDNLSYTNSQDFSESFILKKLEELQKSSKSGKVTIIAHSNGGLVAKALIQKLKDTANPLYEKIDKVILVAVPQVGTPEAMVTMLHGVNVGEGFVMSNERSRQIAENMPVLNNLLPSAGYFTSVITEIPFAKEKMITFPDDPIFTPQIVEYGVDISDETELKNYILGGDDRDKPAYEDTNHPNIGNSTLYNQAQAVHQMLDNWAPEGDTKVIQVAGCGEETIAWLDYKAYKSRKCIFGICGPISEFSFKPRLVMDGDATVVTPSALWMPVSLNVERWWVDLAEYNGILPIFRTEHKNILEIENLRNFIKSKIKNLVFTDSENIILDNDLNMTSTEAHLHYILHSPLTLGIVDSEGRYTGMDPITKEIKEEIPNVTYKKIGDVQFISVPYGIIYTLKLQGYTEGSFSLDVEKQIGNTVTEATTFEGIETADKTLVTMEISATFDVSTSQLKIDEDGDGDVDSTYPIIEEEVVTPPITPTPPPNSSPVFSGGGGGSGFPAPPIASQESVVNFTFNTAEQDVEVVKEVEIVKKIKELNKVAVLKKVIEEPEKDSQVSSKSTEEIIETKTPEEIPLRANVLDSGVNNNWLWYVIILGIVIIGLIFRRFIKI